MSSFTEVELKLQEEVNEVWEQTDNREELFYDVVKERFGLVPTVGHEYLVTLHEYSVWFPSTVTNPAGI